MRFLRLIFDFAPGLARYVRSGTDHRRRASRLSRVALQVGAVVILLLSSHSALAQSVRWEPHEDPNGARLIFEDCTPDGEPQIPSTPGTTFTLVGQAQSTSINNLQTTRSVILTYLVRGPRKFPAFTVKTDKGPLPVATYTAPQTKESVASARLIPGKTTVWAGEVFDLGYVFSASRRHNPQPQPTFDWNAAPLVAEEWPKFEFSEPVRNGDPRIEFNYRTRVYAKTANTIKLEAATHLLHIQTGTLGFGFLTQARMEPVSVTSDQPVIEVKPLPAAPAGFGGAVGQFKLTSRVVPERTAVGEPITWTLELAGTGNWPDIAALPQREVSSDFHAVQPKPKRTLAEGKLFDATLVEDVVLIPKKAGAYTLGPLTFHYFDPKTGAYKKITTEPQTVTIAPAPVDPSAGRNEASPRLDDVARASTARPAPESPAPPAGIPRDPLRGEGLVSPPLPGRTLLLWLLAPVPCLLALWLGLAIRRAQKTDPQRVLREARRRLLATLSALQAATDRAERSALLLAWQRDAALLWQIAHAAPAARAFPDATWTALWTEAERAIYGAAGTLPPDWIARAQEAAVAKRIPGFQPLRLFLPQNLFPFAAALAIAALLLAPCSLLLAAATIAPARSDPFAAYLAGDFAGAEKTWRATVGAIPTDWIARHNLSLALAQQERAGEAAAQATAAFVQNPRDPSVRWHFALTAEKSGFLPAGLEGFLTLGPRHSTARLASPSEWQRVLLAAVWLAALGLAIVLFNAYGARRWPPRLAGLALAMLGTFAAAIAAPAYLTFGVAADARAVIIARAGTLRSIPTEVDTTQKTTLLAAGSTALAIGVFPDRPQDRWVQLEFENGQTGWVRKEDVVGLWK